MAVNYLQNVPRLCGRENFADWSFALENVFVLEGLSKCRSSYDPRRSLNPSILLIPRSSYVVLNPSVYVHVKSAKDAKEIWDTLHNLYEDKGFSRKIGLLRTLISLRFENSDLMEDYIKQVVETVQKLQRAGFEISEE